MPGVTVPESGLVLGPIPAGGGKAGAAGAVQGRQAMRITFDDAAVLEEVLKNAANLKITFGKSARLNYGDESIEIAHSSETHRHEIYRQTDGKLDFIGLFSHNLQIRDVDDNSQDESRAKLRESYEALNEMKSASTTAIVDSARLPPPTRSGAWQQHANLKKNKRMSHSRANSSSSTPVMKGLTGRSTPYGKSPYGKSPGLDGTASKEIDPTHIEALRVPLIHLLALGPASEHSLINKTKAQDDLLAKVLARVARKINNGKQYELMDDIYKDLDVWGFPYRNQADREKAINNAREAFKRMRLPPRAPEFRNLLSAEEKEKWDKEAEAPPKPAPRVATPKTADHGKSPLPPKPADDDSSKTPSTTAGKTTKKAETNLNRILSGKKTKKPVAPPKPKAPTVGRPKVGRPPKSAATKPPANNPKIKSAEIIEDSDEDLDMEDLISKPPPPRPAAASPVKTTPMSMSMRASASPLPPPPAPKAASKSPLASAPTPKPSSRPPSAASRSRDSDIEPDARPQKRPATSAPTNRSPIKKQRVETAGKSPATKSPATKSPLPKRPVAAAKAPRDPTRGSSNSPPKPSPLGSSPPINASDRDAPASRSTSSASPSFLTGSTTPDSTVTKPKATPRYAGSGAAKRKPHHHDDDDRRARVNGRVEKPSLTALQLARKFKEQYQRYERLYREVQQMTDARKKRETTEEVLAMHRSLESLKERIATAH